MDEMKARREAIQRKLADLTESKAPWNEDVPSIKNSVPPFAQRKERGDIVNPALRYTMGEDKMKDPDKRYKGGADIKPLPTTKRDYANNWYPNTKKEA